LFFQCNFACSIWSVIQAASGLYPLTSITNVFGNWVHGIIGWERLHLFGRFGFGGMTKFLIIKIVLSCRLSTDVWALYVYDRSFTAWRTTTYFWRCARAWWIRRDSCFRGMDGSIIYGLALHHPRRLTISHPDMYFAYVLFFPDSWLSGGVDVCI
jgi:hypothetical protein